MGEFVTLIALMISLVALSIDAMLPALPAIGRDLGVANDNDRQWVISAMFLGFSVGQVFYGPISDSIGRKRSIYAGALLFLVGCVLSVLSTTFELMLAGRVLQGLGAASSRTVSLAIVRDQYQGPAMARVMSIIMSVFIVVPAVAPALGQAVMKLFEWRAIFVLLLLQALVSVVWFWLRQPETLTPEDRVPFSASAFLSAAREVFTNRITMGYTLAGAFVSGAFIGYLVSAQQIFVDVYGAGDLFPLYFAGLALSIGTASLVNSRLVMRLGMQRLAVRAVAGLTLLSLVFTGVTFAMGGQPPLWALMLYLVPLFFCIGIVFGNVNSMAMEPMGHVAGMAAAIIGSLMTFLSLVLGTIVSQSYDGSARPLIVGFAVMGVVALFFMVWTPRRRPRSSSPAPTTAP
jgi:DHA1 family bicyclomycin/chloramphenicol resistance-like MFS transporter